MAQWNSQHPRLSGDGWRELAGLGLDLTIYNLPVVLTTSPARDCELVSFIYNYAEVSERCESLVKNKILIRRNAIPYHSNEI
jgi:hypothetical protein